MAALLELLNSTTGVLLVGALIVAIFGAWLMRTPSFARTDFAYRFPIVGKLARYSRDYSETMPGEWLNSEARLCHDYSRHLSGLSPDEFHNHKEYMRKCYDNGRKPLPGLIVVLLATLVLFEGLGFSYLLSTWMALEGSENTRQLLTVAIVTVVSAVLVWTMHSAGHQLYRTRLLRSCFQQFQAYNLNDRKAHNPNRRFTTEILALNQDQSRDDHEPSHVQCANRVAVNPSDTGSYSWLWIGGIFVAAIAILSTILRIETLHSDPFAVAGAANPNQLLAREYAALSSFWILATIFVVTQFVGVGVGYRYGFAGRESDTAYRLTNGAPDYESYYRPIARRMAIADSRLADLHGMMERRSPGSINWTRDFYEFVQNERERGVCDLHHPLEVQRARAQRMQRSEEEVRSRRAAAANKANGAYHPSEPVGKPIRQRRKRGNPGTEEGTVQ